jgi:hypothetical protein
VADGQNEQNEQNDGVVRQLFVFIYEEGGLEHVAIAPTAQGNIPMITIDEQMKEKMKPLAQSVANSTHKTVKVLKFTNREDLEEIEEQLVKPV